MSALLALSSSLLWGTGDFLGGRASRNFSVLRVLLWSQTAMFVLMWFGVGLVVTTGNVDLNAHALLVGAAGGAAGVVGLAAFYRALAIGPMAVVPPIAAAGVVLPVSVGLATGAAPSAVVIAGLLAAIVGVVLASIGEGGSSDASGAVVPTRIAPATIGLCLIAAIGFALIFVALDSAAGDSAWTALIATAGARTGSLTVLVLAKLFTRTHMREGVTTRDAAGFAVIGMFDTSANLLFATAAAFGQLEIVAVLGSLYPAVTSGLAHVVLGERLGRVQLVGVVLALVGVALLAGR